MKNKENVEQMDAKHQMKKWYGVISWILTSIIILIILASALYIVFTKVGGAATAKINVYLFKYLIQYVYGSGLGIAQGINGLNGFLVYALCGMAVWFATMQRYRYRKSKYGKAVFITSLIFAIILLVLRLYAFNKILMIL